VLNRQREAIYGDRRHILEGDDLHERTQQFLEDVIDEVLDVHTAEGNPDEWDFDALWTELKTLYPIGITIDEVVAEAGEKGRVNRDFVRREILSDAKLAYQRREEQLGSPAMRELERRVVLSVIDRRWRDHLYEMDYLKDGIGLRAMAQRDPLVEYQREGFAMFQQMMGSIREETVGFLFNLEVEVAPQAGVGPTIQAKGLSRQETPGEKLSYSAPSDAGGVEVRNQRGQVQQAATQRARRAVAETQAPAVEPARGAFGQRTDGGEVQPQNRAERRAQDRKGR
jgi:preprotein translocase subunit SecA